MAFKAVAAPLLGMLLAAHATVAADTKYFITFGDSYSQTGFDITLDKATAANILGNPAYPGWTTSGGINWIDSLIAEHNTSLVLSYNFAYGGATVDASIVTPYTSTVLSMADQVAEFQDNLASRPSYAPWTADDALAGVWIGVNDVGNTFQAGNKSDIVVACVNRYFELLQDVADAGITKFVLLSIPPTNLSPLMLANSASAEDLLVAAIKQYNGLLSSRIKDFETNNPGVKVVLVDTTDAFTEAIDNPTKYGAPDATCYNSDGTSCLWYNNYHPGIAIHELVADAVASALGPIHW